MYEINTTETIDKIFEKLAKKNLKQLLIIRKKLKEIMLNPHRYKNLRSPLQNFKRVHVNKHFVLVFSINEKSKFILLENYDHHDNIYK